MAFHRLADEAGPSNLKAYVTEAHILESLSRRLQEEEQESEFSALPFHYMEIAQMLLET